MQHQQKYLPFATEMVELLYTRSVFQGFRKPVITMYPSLMSSYMAVIQNPMDLGSLLLILKLMQVEHEEELKSSFPKVFAELSTSGFDFLVWLRNQLGLIYSNSLNFNKENPLMEAISHHLDYCSEALFEDFFHRPYNNEVEHISDAFSVKLWQSRVRRFIFIQNVPLSIAELKLLLKLLNEAYNNNDSHLPIDVQDCIGATSAEISHLEGNTDPSAAVELSLKDILEWPHASSPCPQPEDDPAESLSDGRGALLQRLSRLLILVEERVLRGVTYSCIWARPGDLFVWARPSQSASKDASRPRASWYPGMVVAVPSSGELPMPKELVEANVRRIPEGIRRQLARFRPRTKKDAPSSSSPQDEAQSVEAEEDPAGFCPEGHLLVEFFGLHDFGWVKAEAAEPLLLLELPPDGPASDSSGLGDPRLSLPPARLALNAPSVAASKLCNRETLDEAKQALLWWTRHRRSLVYRAGSEGLGLGSVAAAEEVVVAAAEALGCGLRGREDAADLPAPPPLRALKASLSEPCEEAPLEALVSKKRRPAPVDSASVSDSASTNSCLQHPKRPRSDPLPAPATSAGRTLDEALLAGVDFDALTSSAPAFQLSRMPTLESVLHAALKSHWTCSAKQQLCSTRNKAILASRIAMHWMDKVRPLQLPHMNREGGSPGQAPLSADEDAGSSSAATEPGDVASSAASAVGPAAASRHVVDGAVARRGAVYAGPAEAPAPPPKRKYVFKNRLPSAAMAAGASRGGSGTSSGSYSAAAAVAALSGSSYLNVTAAVAATAFLLDSEGGCSRFLAGDGVVYTRTVDESAAIFQREHRSCEVRKRILREELRRIQQAVEDLQEAARKRAEGSRQPGSSQSGGKKRTTHLNDALAV